MVLDNYIFSKERKMYENFVREKYNIPSYHKLRPTQHELKEIYEEIDPQGQVVGKYEVDIITTPFNKERCIKKLKA